MGFLLINQRRSGGHFGALSFTLSADAHAVKRAPHEIDGDGKEYRGEYVAQRDAFVVGQLHGKLHGEQAEERGELDDRIQSYR